MKKIILDTDIGGDIDDSLALSYLLKQPACDLLGITTVSGDVVTRAKMASVLCNLAGKGDVPIYPGLRKSIIPDKEQIMFLKEERLAQYAHKTDFPKGEAIEFLRETIRKNPGEVTLLGIGPYNNIAALFTVDEEIPSLLKELVLMGGKYWDSCPECNAYTDPHASYIVYHSNAKIRNIGLDVTMQTQMPKEEVTALAEGTLCADALRLSDAWFDHCPLVTFHDPLAAATIFDEEICTYQEGVVNYALEGDQKWVTYFEPRKGTGHFVADTVDTKRFYDH